MNDDKPLHYLYERFRAGKLGRHDFEAAIFRFVRDNPRRFKISGWREDDREEFIAELYPTIRKAIDAYRDVGSCFDAYAYTAIRWEARGYRSRKAEKATIERAYWMTAAETASDEESFYSCGNDAYDQDPQCPPSRKKRQILALTLKCCLKVSDDLCRRIAPSVGLRPDELESKLNGLRTLVAERAVRRQELEELAAAHYCRGMIMAAKAIEAPSYSDKKRRFEKSAAVAKQRHANCRDRASKISVEATNREVAEALGVPKGTIDASIYFLKQKSAPLYDPRGPRV